MPETIFEKSKIMINSLFVKENSPTSRTLEPLLFVILMLFGIVLWLRFFNFGDIPRNRLDWNDITYPRLMVLQQSITQGQLPLFVAQENSLKGVTDLFLTIPDQILSPDVFLLKFFSIEQFIVIHTIFFYIIGFFGLVLFQKKYNLSFIAFIPLFLLFNFNGHIVAHLAVGHLTWASYFLLPYFFLLLLESIENNCLGWRWVARFSFLQLLVFLSGGYHMFVWIIFFLGIMIISNRKKQKTFFYALVFSILVNAFRILPGALLQGKLLFEFEAGFPSIEKFLQSILIMSLPEFSYSPSLSAVDVTIWEFNFYFSVLGFLFILFFSTKFFAGHKKEAFKLLIPIGIIFLLSFGNIYRPLFELGLPLVSGERFSSRFFILPGLMLLFLATIQFQSFLSKNSDSYLKFGIVIFSVILANDLTQHMANWNLEKIKTVFPAEIDKSNLFLGFGTNTQYFSMLNFGIIISLASIIFLIMKCELFKNSDVILLFKNRKS